MQTSRIKRVLLVSPAQIEMTRRGFSKIWITIEGESAIDALLNQSVRNMEDYVDVSKRAIAYAQLADNYGDLIPSYTNEGSSNGAHLETASWLMNDQGTVFDIVLALDYQNEPRLDDISVVTIMQQDDPVTLDGAPLGERPLVMLGDIEILTMGLGEDLVTHGRRAEDNNQNDDRENGGQGRVKDPTTDGRLKENGGGENGQGDVRSENDGRLQENREPVAARSADQSGRRGRVANPLTDRRTRANRRPTAERRPNPDDRPDGGGAGGNGGGAGPAGGSGRSTGGSGSGGGATAHHQTWEDGRPRTVEATKKDGQPRRKPGPALGTRYRPRVGFTDRHAA